MMRCSTCMLGDAPHWLYDILLHFSSPIFKSQLKGKQDLQPRDEIWFAPSTRILLKLENISSGMFIAL